MKRVSSLLPLILFCSLLSRGGAPLHAQQPSPFAPESRSYAPDQQRSKTATYIGPWGKLDTSEIIIESPEEYIKTYPMLHKWEEGTVWRLNGNATLFRLILQRAGLSGDDAAKLTAPPFFKDRGAHVEIRPPDDTVIGLSRAQRLDLYTRIGLEDPDDTYRYALQLLPGGIPRMGKPHEELNPELVELAAQLSYVDRTGNTYLSDTPLLFQRAGSDRQRVLLMQFLTRELSERAYLDLSDAPENKEEMLSYWSAEGKNLAVPEILRSAIENPDVERLEILHMLPTGPRKFLNTFSPPEAANGGRYPNCYSTAMSFFGDDMVVRLLDFEAPQIDNNYVRAQPPWQFGDIIVIYDAAGNWSHVCNYIAGELVFTKNGIRQDRPWVFQRLDDLLSTYLTKDSIQAVFYRLKPGLME